MRALDEKLLIRKAGMQHQGDDTDPSALTNADSDTLIDRFKLISHCITSMSNFSVQYNFQAISVALLIMTEVVCTADDGKCKSGDQVNPPLYFCDNILQRNLPLTERTGRMGERHLFGGSLCRGYSGPVDDGLRR